MKKASAASRNFGLSIVGLVSWGTHLCQFYESKQDLIDILVPYFAEGLMSNEFCMWVTSPPLEVEEAKDALAKAVPNLQDYFSKGQIEIISYNNWYLLSGKFDASRVLQGWVEKEQNALKRGFAGLRLTGNTFWIERDLWQSFVDYEAAVNEVIGEHKMLALCTYCLTNCSGTDVLDVVRNHVGTLVKQENRWYLVEDAARRKAVNGALKLTEKRYSALFENMQDGFAFHKLLVDETGRPIDYVFLEANAAFERLTGLGRAEIIGRKVTEVLPGIEKDPADWIGTYGKVALAGEPVRFENYTATLQKWYQVAAYSPEKGYFVATFEDITERKKAEEALRESEEEYRSLFTNMKDGFAFCQMLFGVSGKPADFVYLQINDAFEKITGLKREAVIGRKVSEAIPGTLDEHPELLEIYGRVAQTGRDEKFEINFKPLNLWLSVSAYCPQKGYFAAIFEDISERKSAEEALKKLNDELEERVEQRTAQVSAERQRLYNVLETLPSYVILLDRDYRVRFANKVFRETFGEDHGRRCHEYLFGKDHECEDCETYKVYRQNKSQHWYWTGPNGRDYDIYDFPFKDTDGSTLILEMGVDITERRRAEAELAKHRDNLEELVKERTEELWQAKNDWERTFDSVPDLIAILDNNHKIVRANKAMAKTLGVKPEQAIGLHCYSCVHETDAPPDFCPHSKSIQDGKQHIEEVNEPRLGGYYLVSTTPLFDEKGCMTGSVHVARDITDRKQMQTKLEEYAAHLEELVQERTLQLKDAERLTAIGETAGMVGHDLRNPLQTVTGETFLAKDELRQLPDSPSKRNLEENINIIAEQIGYMDKIVSDLQDFVRPINPEKKPVNLRMLLGATLSETRLPENVEAQTEYSKNLPEVSADGQLLKRVFLNLFTNAVQAMPQGGKLLIKAAFTKPKAGSGKVTVTVQDTGEGIPDNVRAKMFKPLFTTKSKGQGFGLAVCKRVIEAHGGTITFESKLGQGTKFTVELPT